METLVYLEGLHTERWVKLKSIWRFDQDTQLQWLDVSGCSRLEELPKMETMVSLEALQVSKLEYLLSRSSKRCTS